MSCIVCTVGIPACGKSTFSRLLFDTLKKNFPHHVVITVCYDSLISWEQMTNEVNVDSMSEWKSRRKLILKAVSMLLEECCSGHSCPVEDDVEQMKLNILKRNGISDVHSSRSKLIAIIDDNLYYSSMRYEFYQIAKFNACGFCELYFHCDINTALERNKVRDADGIVSDSTIREMAEKLEKPNFEKKDWEQNCLIIDADTHFSDIQIERAINLIHSAMDNPVISYQQDQLQTEQKEESRAISKTNVIHQIDVRLRKLTKQIINEFGFKDQYKFQHVLEAKSGVLQDLKQGALHLPLHLIESITEGTLDRQSDEQVNAVLLDRFRKKLKTLVFK